MSRQRVSGFPEKGADLQASPGNFRGSPENFRGSLGTSGEHSGLLLSSTVRELPGKSLNNFRGSSGNFRGLSRSSGEPGFLPATRQLCLQLITGCRHAIGDKMMTYGFSCFRIFSPRLARLASPSSFLSHVWVSERVPGDL